MIRHAPQRAAILPASGNRRDDRDRNVVFPHAWALLDVDFDQAPIPGRIKSLCLQATAVDAAGAPRIDVTFAARILQCA